MNGKQIFEHDQLVFPITNIRTLYRGSAQYGIPRLIGLIEADPIQSIMVPRLWNQIGMAAQTFSYSLVQLTWLQVSTCVHYEKVPRDEVHKKG